MQLKGSTNLTVPVPRPKGMHRATFERLRETAEEAECHVWQLFGLRLQRLDRLREALERRTKHTVRECKTFLQSIEERRGRFQR